MREHQLIKVEGGHRLRGLLEIPAYGKFVVKPRLQFLFGAKGSSSKIRKPVSSCQPTSTADRTGRLLWWRDRLQHREYGGDLGDNVQEFGVAQVLPASLNRFTFDKVHVKEAFATEEDILGLNIKDVMNLGNRNHRSYKVSFAWSGINIAFQN